MSLRARIARLIVVACAGAGVVVGTASGAAAHALLQTSTPNADATLSASPPAIIITFGERPDTSLSSITVLDTAGKTRASGDLRAVAGQALTYAITVPTLPKGVYTVAWKTVSAVDGHLATGTYAFGIGVAPTGSSASTTGSARTQSPSVATVTARWLFLGGLMLVFGVAFSLIALAVEEASWPRLRTLLLGGYGAAFVGVVAMSEIQRQNARVSIATMMGDSLGHTLFVRLIPVAIGAIPVVLIVRGPHARRRPLGVALLVTTVVAMAADVTTSHADAAHTWKLLKLTTQTVHFAAVGLWLGGLASLLAMLSTITPERRRTTARTFSRWATLGLAAAVLTGALRSFDEIHTWHGLLHSGYGQAVVIKVLLAGVLALLGALNRFRYVEQSDTDPIRLRIIGSIEIAVVVVVLVVTGALQNLAPPTTAAAQPTNFGPIALDASDFGTTVRIHLTVTPGTPGFNRFRLDVVDYDTRRPVVASLVRLTFHFPARTDIGDSTLTLARQADGSYQAGGANLAIMGRYEVAVLVQRASESTVVPIVVVTQSPRLIVTTQRFSGQAPVYTAKLPGGDQMQIAADLGLATGNQLHITVFDSTGHETQISALTVTDAIEPKGSATVLNTTRGDAIGHFIADVASGKGTHRFAIVATTQAGDAIGATLDIAP